MRASVPRARTSLRESGGLPRAAAVLNIAGDVEAMSRSGQAGELLRGPLAYGLVFTAATLLAFRRVIAAAALMALCAGDGMADVVGRRWGGAPRMKLPWSSRKSWPGSAAFFVSAFAGSSAFGTLFAHWGWTSVPVQSMLVPLPGSEI